MEIIPRNIKKILIIKPRGIGDIVLSTIVIDSLLAHFKNVKIDYLVEKFAVDVLLNNPMINNIISFDKSDFILKTILKVRKEKYDLIIDLWSNPKTAQITFFSGAKYRIGYEYRGRKFAYNIFGTKDRGISHSALHNLELLKVIGIKIISKRIHYYTDKQDEIFAENFFNQNNLNKKIIVGIIPSGGWESKRCPKEKWVEILNKIISQLDCKILVLWGPGDYLDAAYINNQLKNDTILSPKTNLNQIAALIKKCSLIIANDSGPMHIASALNVPTLGLFGPTSPENHRPFSDNSDFVIKQDLHCIICNKLNCPFNKECFYQMDSDEILNKSKILLQKNA
jgi:lipopolysaccharide heptosyltransferase II